MKGQIFVINLQKHTGAIAAENGQHVLFSLSEWTDAAPPERGMPVEFELNAEGQACAVKPAATSQAAVMPPPAPPSPTAPAASVPPPFMPTAPAAPAATGAPPPFTPAPAASSAQNSALRHSGLGIAAFILSLGLGFLALIFLIAAGVAAGEGEEEAAEVIAGVSVVLLFLQILPLVMGIVGLRQGGRKKLFPLLGTILSAQALLFTLITVIAGILVEEETGYAEDTRSPTPASATNSRNQTADGGFEWTEGWGMGVSEYSVEDGNGNLLLINCPNYQEDGEGYVSAMATISGKDYWSKSDDSFDVILDGVRYQDPFYTNCRACGQNFRTVFWPALRRASQLQITARGRTVTLSTRKLSEVLLPLNSPENPCVSAW